MSGSRILGLLLLAPAFVFVVLFFLAPVVLTAVFALTNMSTATGITGGAYQITQSAMRELGERHGEEALADALARVRYTVDRSGIDAASAEGASTALVTELDRRLAGQSFDSRRELERAIKKLDNRPRGTRALKALSALFERSIVNARFATEEEFFDAVAGLGIELDATQRAALLATTYTGWSWTGENFSRMFSLPDTRRTFLNTIIYVFATLTIFNTGFALVLAIVTHYMPDRPAGIFRAIWLLPRISPPVLYVLLWKWLAWDTGFLSRILVPLGFESRNWLLDNPTNAWVFVVLINGFVGASMGMLIFSAAIRSIPVPLFYAKALKSQSRHFARLLEGRAGCVASSVLHLHIPRDMRRANSHLTIAACTVIEEGKAQIDFDSRLIKIEIGRAKLLVWRLSRNHVGISLGRNCACRGIGQCPCASGQR